MKRAIPTDVLAIRYAMGCSIPSLRRAALAHVLRAIRSHGGHAGQTAAALGMDRKTFYRLRVDHPDLEAAINAAVSADH